MPPTRLARSDELQRRSAEVEDDAQQREKVYRLLIVVLVGVLVATWVAVVWLVQGKNSSRRRTTSTETKESFAAGPDAQAAAEGILGEMISFDYRDIGDEYDWTSTSRRRAARPSTRTTSPRELRR